ncbi:cytochrome-c peroxidase [Thalassomonas actiniarum]|uniref:Cytochrome C peroxidase n=1 Tax=Thalassomonas actiniarum TaxID=485447 RepID=A0AAF0C3X0_9GAMM|nr:cytochrome c peroxidase [Thalassomonas actiniarum]WDE01662.1 hypothetical protein SG35_014155 [Thalassomonas actiniarum]
MDIYSRLQPVRAKAIKLLAPMALLLAGDALADISSPPQQLIVDTLSASEIRLSWKAPQGADNIKGYHVFRDNKRITNTRRTSFIDEGLDVNTRYSYHVVAFDPEKNTSPRSNSDSAKTLAHADNDGMRNGSVLRTGILNLQEVCGVRTIAEVPAEKLDSCLDTVIQDYTLKEGLEDIRAYVARLRKQEDPALIDLGMRLFHSKSLSQNDDTSCSSCHHPALGCGGDGLSLPIGVNADNPDLLGPGRSDGNAVPLVGRHSPHICNSALWVDSMFWDQRVATEGSGGKASTSGAVSTADVRTPEADVTASLKEQVDNTDPLRLLIAQAHFPVTADAEMGSSAGFASPQSYRAHIATKLEQDWSQGFNEAFGSEEISFMRIARAIAAYEASFLFIDNPFFDYIDGNRDSLNEAQKRGALFFYTGSGCANCHDGVFFTPEATRGPVYPQLGIHAGSDGNAKGQFRMPSLLNVGITAPYGDKGVFTTLERVIEHYNDTNGSLIGFYENNEACQLPQFKGLTDEECRSVVGEGEERVMALQEARRAESDRNNDNPTKNLTADEISYLAAFLHTLTDKSALAGSNEINALIPPRDGGPDGNQLDAVDKEGKAL